MENSTDKPAAESAPGRGSAFRAWLYASLDGATCAREGKKPDANPYAETDDLHFVWIGAWTDARMEMLEQHPSVRRMNAAIDLSDHV